MPAPLTDPFWVHHLDPGAVRRTWRRGGAAVVEVTRPMARREAVLVIGVGGHDDLAPLFAEAAVDTPTPDRVMVAGGTGDVLPPAWRPAAPRSWHWMLTRTAPRPPAHPVVAEPDPADVDAVLDVAMPETHARPGTPGVEAWLGVRPTPDGPLVGVGAVARQPDGTGNLRGVAVLPSYAGRGLGRSLSAALTTHALAGASGVATLGVYVDNVPAVALYERLGYRTVHTFYSGELSA